MEDMITIRKAIIKNRGGWEEAPDKALLSLWQQLPPATRTQYLESIEEKQEKKRTGKKETDDAPDA